MVEYSVAGSNSWTALTVSSDDAGGYAYVDLPIDQLQNATTYAFRFSITDCAGQTTQSGTYYFKVDRPDQPPIFLCEPLWVGPWIALSTDPANPHKPQSENMLFWAIDDDAVACTGTEVNWKYRPVQLQAGEVVALGDWVIEMPSRFMQWIWIEAPGIADIPASPGVYEFKMTVTDCMDQMTDSKVFFGKRYYFQVD
jgi:hypothetical protein